jgi:hypothetical protein
MIEQRENQLVLSFPTPEAARVFAQFLTSQSQPLAPETSEPPSEPSQQRSHHVLLTDDRLEQLSNQRAQGLTAHQRLLRAQSSLRDGVLPFSKPGQAPQPTNQSSPRMRAQQEGGFADGGAVAVRPTAPQLRSPDLQPQADPVAAHQEAGRRPSKLRPVTPSQISPKT